MISADPEEILVWNIAPCHWPSEYWFWDKEKKDEWRKENGVKLVKFKIKK